MEAHAECLGWIHPSRNPSRWNAVRAHGSNTCNPRMHSHGSDARWDRKRTDSFSRISPHFKKLLQDHKKTELRSSEQHDGISSRKFEEEYANNEDIKDYGEQMDDSTTEHGLYRVIVEREHWAHQAAVRARTDPADGDTERRLLEAKIARAEKLFADANRLARLKAKEAEEAAFAAQKAHEYLQSLKSKQNQCAESGLLSEEEVSSLQSYYLAQKEDFSHEVPQDAIDLEKPPDMPHLTTNVSSSDVSNTFRIGIRPRSKTDLSSRFLDRTVPGGPLNHEPRIVLFELDGAICESFEDTSGPPFRPCSPARIRDTNDKEIVIQKGALEVFKTLSALDRSNLHVAILSRITKPGWTEEFLESIQITRGTSMRDIVDFVVVQSGLEKTRQLSETLRAVMAVSSIQNLKRRTKVEYNQMLFFGKESRVCRDLTSMGITSVRVPYGITVDIWEDGLKHFAENSP